MKAVALTRMNTEMSFEEAVGGLLRGDFSRLAPLFDSPPDESLCPIIKWYEAGLFANEPKALDEAFTCACFNGRTNVVRYFLARGNNPSGGCGTGLNAFHWAANRGQLEVVKLLIQHKAPVETPNMYGGTVLGCAVWSAIHEPRPDHIPIIQALIDAGANIAEADIPQATSAWMKSFGVTEQVEQKLAPRLSESVFIPRSYTDLGLRARQG